MFRVRVAILLIFIVQFAFKLEAQTLVDTTCVGEWRYYEATPDPNFQNSTFEWVFYGGVDNYVTQNNGRQIKIHWGNRSGRFKLGVSEISEFGCTQDTSFAFIEVKGNAIEIPDVDVCQGQSYSVEAFGTFNSFTWRIDTLVNTSESNTFEGVATVTDSLFVTGNRTDQCSNTASALITVHPLPKITFTANGDTVKGPLTICGDGKVVLDAGSDGMTYDWSTEEFTQAITLVTLPPLKTVDHEYFSVNVTTDWGCSSSDSVKVMRCSVLDTIPGAFTPNGDGINDLWEVPYLKYFPTAVIDIYDRWGNSVYHSEHGYPKPWDGRVNGVLLPTENYFYIIKLDKKSKPIVGNLTIVR